MGNDESDWISHHFFAGKKRVSFEGGVYRAKKPPIGLGSFTSKASQGVHPPRTGSFSPAGAHKLENED